MLFQRAPKFLVHFNDGAFVKQLSGKGKYTVNFVQNNTVEYSDSITTNKWLKTNLKYHIPWIIEIRDQKNKCILRHQFDLNNKSVRINIDSKCLGDTLAWVPQIEQFALQHPATKIHVSQFLHGLGLEQNYPNLVFIDPEKQTQDVYATYKIGYYLDRLYDYHPVDPRTVTLGRVASDILGISYREIRTRLQVQNTMRPFNRPYVCIATQSTAGCKLWQYKNGWQMVVDYLRDKGLEVVVIQKEACHLEHVIDKSGNLSLQDRMTDLKHCEFFIGLGSGLSWLAWALSKRVILISGFSLPHSEFSKDCLRVINTKVCHGCWNSSQYVFDRDDWNWCPEFKNTQRQFECSKTIKPQQVFKAIDILIRGQSHI